MRRAATTSATRTDGRARTGRAVVLVTAAALSAADLSAKAISESRLTDTSIDLGVLELRLAFNPGVAFSLGDRLPAATIVVATASIVVALVVYAWRRAPDARSVEHLAGGAVIGGALANVIDRARDGVVTDYLHTGWWPTFNLADTCLVIGSIVLAIIHLRPQRETAKA